MKLDKNTILVTGGATGIGLALAKRFLEAGSQVITCGRREEALAEAKRQCPGLRTVQCDLSLEAERRSLVEKVTRDFPALNVLVNNAGTQNRLPPLTQPQDWARHSQEIAINLEAPLHLSMLLIPHLLKQAEPAILNVSSGLAFVPLAFIPTYCATKAALHSFTMSLRQQLLSTPIKVVEIVPPAVNTDLGGKGLHDFGVPLDEFADSLMPHLEKGELEFGHSFSDKVRLASREELDRTFAEMNKPRG